MAITTLYNRGAGRQPIFREAANYEFVLRRMKQYFVECYRPGQRHLRRPTRSDTNSDGRWRCYSYADLIARDKVSLDIFWLRDDSLEDTANLPHPDVLALEMIEDLEAALEQLREIAEDVGEGEM